LVSFRRRHLRVCSQTTILKTLVPFRGRCSFKQYMPSKPAKYGLKFWCLCDASTAYCLRMQPYLGIDHGAVRTTNLGKKVCYQGILSGPSKATAGPGNILAESPNIFRGPSEKKFFIFLNGTFWVYFWPKAVSPKRRGARSLPPTPPFRWAWIL